MRAWFTEADLVAMVGEDVLVRAIESVELETTTVSAGEIVSTFDGDGVPFEVRLTGADGVLVGECGRCGDRPRFCEHCVAVAWFGLDFVALPDLDAFRARLEPFTRHRKLSSANYEPWARDASSLAHDLEIAAICHPALIRPLYQRLMWHVAHTPAYFDTHEAYYRLLDIGKRIVEGLAWICAKEPADPRELGRWTAELEVGRRDIQTPLHVDVFYDGLDDAAKAAYGERLAELQRALPVLYADEEEPRAQAERRWWIGELRERFALSRDPGTDELVAFHAENAGDPMRHVSMAEVLRSAGRFAEAIDLLEGDDPRPARGDVVLAELYSAVGRHQEAARLRLADFVRFPRPYAYEALLAAAAPIDAVEYAKQRALGHVTGLRDRDEAVRLVLQLDEVAWCWESAPDDVVVALADELAGRGGADEVPLLARGARTAIDHRSNHPLAARLLVALRRLHSRIGRDFTPGLAYFTASYGHREELVRALREAGL
ncbi:hypothetical protein AB0425_01480 [Actinosynnema sp. NPDC051121]